MTLRKIIFDTETTGLGKDKRAVEVAMMEIDDDLSVIGTAHSLVNPGIPITEKALEIHGITEEMVKDAPTVEQWVQEAFGGPLEGDIVLIGHRIAFDRPLFAPIGNAVHTLDTLVLAQLHITGPENRKLDTLKAYLSLPGGGDSHRAMADVLTCYQLLQHLVKVSGRSLSSLVAVPFWILHYMPWGKHEDKLLQDVPRSYRDWLLSLEDLDLSLRKSLELIALTDKPVRPVVIGAPREHRIFIPTRKR